MSTAMMEMPIYSPPDHHIRKRRVKPDPLRIASQEQIIIDQLEFELAQAKAVAEKGYAIILSDLASERGMTVKDIAGFPQHLLSAGLPPEIPDNVLREAHMIRRNAVEGAFYRLGLHHQKGLNLPPAIAEKVKAAKMAPTSPETPAIQAAKPDQPAPPKAPKPVKIATAPKEPAIGTGAMTHSKKGMFGFAACRVVFWMFRHEYTVEEVQKVCYALNANVKPATILYWKKMVELGDPKSVAVASLSNENVDAIRHAAGRN